MSVLPVIKNLPLEITQSTRAVCWKYELRDGQQTKVPYMPHRPQVRAAIDNAETWGSFRTAYDSVADGKADGVGIVLGNGLLGIDLDHCRRVETGAITPEARALIRVLNSYTEVSPSGEGLHVLAKGTLPPGRRRRNGLELYADARYFTITGQHLAGTPRDIFDRTKQLAVLHAETFGPSSSAPLPPTPAASSTTPLTDAEVIALAMRAQNGDLFAQLWAGDTSRYQGDDSAADLALANLLVFYTQHDAQIDRLFRMSGLFRPKWDSRRGTTTYGAITIAKAIRDSTATYTPAIDIKIEIDEPAPAASEPPAADPLRQASWPTLTTDALIGPFGDFVELLGPTTEADPVGLLVHTLVCFGNLVGHGPRVAVGDDLHHINENALVIGDTSVGRKGMAANAAKALMAEVDPDWMAMCVQAGLSSGEGLVAAVRDPLIGADDDVADPGVTDKRLLILETEFAKVLRVSRREANTLSTILRQCWDDGNLRVLTRHSPLKATGAHVSVIGHCTPLELRQELKTTDMASGFVNRFVLVVVRRPHLRPLGGRPDPEARAALVSGFRLAAAFARTVNVLTRDEDANEHWRSIYEHLTRARVGLLGAICNRAPAHVLRLSALYALAERSTTIQRRHQTAAIALWHYAEQSTALIFGHRVGHRLANFLLELLRSVPTGVTRSQIRDALGRNRHADEISEALHLLRDLGLATYVTEQVPNSPGRPTERWKAELGTT